MSNFFDYSLKNRHVWPYDRADESTSVPGDFPFRVSPGADGATKGILISPGSLWVIEVFDEYPVSPSAHNTSISEYDYSGATAPLLWWNTTVLDADRTLNFIPYDVTIPDSGVWLWCQLDPFVAIGTRPTIENFYIDAMLDADAVDVPYEKYYFKLMGLGGGYWPLVTPDNHGLISVRMNSVTAGFTPGEPAQSGYATIAFHAQ